VQGSLPTEQFGSTPRTSGASTGYPIAASVGGFAPLIAALLVGAMGWPGASFVVLLAASIGLVGILPTRETWSRQSVAPSLSCWRPRTPGSHSPVQNSGEAGSDRSPLSSSGSAVCTVEKTIDDRQVTEGPAAGKVL
jgi:hypothetical protein